ncbi:MAG: anti-sigma factor [Actinomycetota bacterium]|nr:anti-sigma factor [Actinomycetota bacterium]
MSTGLHDLTGAYCLDALDTEEREDFELHVQSCHACADEVRQLSATAARLAAAVSVPVPAKLRAAVLSAIARTPQLPAGGWSGDTGTLGAAGRATEPVVPESPRTQRHDTDGVPTHGPSGEGGPAPRGDASPDASVHELRPAGPRRAWRSPALLAAAASVAAAVGLGGLVLDQRADLERARRDAAAIAAVAADPQRTEARGQANGGGSVTVMSAGGRTVVVTEDLPALPEDKTYQLWVVREGGADVRSAGLLDDAADGTVSQLVSGAANADKVAISVEPEGGSDAPTTTPVVAVDV